MNSTLNTLSIDSELADRLERDPQFRAKYIRRWAQIQVASGIRALRKRRRKRQGEVAALAGTGQSAISRIEKADYDGWTFKTLLAVAETLDAQLSIEFRPIEEVLSEFRSQSNNAGTEIIHDLDGTEKAAEYYDDPGATADSANVASHQ
jgi:transcriptional regulator with XRE-family HTH domain